jgi:hypothetical protein
MSNDFETDTNHILKISREGVKMFHETSNESRIQRLIRAKIEAEVERQIEEVMYSLDEDDEIVDQGVAQMQEMIENTVATYLERILDNV